jgi:hypothetical protein
MPDRLNVLRSVSYGLTANAGQGSDGAEVDGWGAFLDRRV